MRTILLALSVVMISAFQAVQLELTMAVGRDRGGELKLERPVSEIELEATFSRLAGVTRMPFGYELIADPVPEPLQPREMYKRIVDPSPVVLTGLPLREVLNQLTQSDSRYVWRIDVV